VPASTAWLSAARVVQRFAIAPHLEDGDTMFVEGVCGDDEIFAPGGLPRE
jgi:hypothetical protein